MRVNRGDHDMLRRIVIAVAAAATIGVAASTGALAAPHGDHFGGRFGGHFGHFGGGPGFSFGFGVSPGYAYDYDYDGCYRLHRVWTPLGWRLRRVYVCG
jgi:hypothetical protein